MHGNNTLNVFWNELCFAVSWMTKSLQTKWWLQPLFLETLTVTVGPSDLELYISVSQLFENIGAFDIDGEGEVSLNQFKWSFWEIFDCFKFVFFVEEEEDVCNSQVSDVFTRLRGRTHLRGVRLPSHDSKGWQCRQFIIRLISKIKPKQNCRQRRRGCSRFLILSIFFNPTR